MSEVSIKIDSPEELEETIADVFGMDQADPGLGALSEAVEDWVEHWEAEVEVRNTREYVDIVIRLPK